LPPVEPVYISRPGEVIAEAASAAAVFTAHMAYTGAIAEAASAAAVVSFIATYAAAITEAATATAAPDATVIVGLVARSAMLPGVFVNSDGTWREANVAGVMVNL
jgi:energy-converting hydrogenase Eha subunit B